MLKENANHSTISICQNFDDASLFMIACARFAVHAITEKPTLLPPKSNIDLAKALSKLGIPQAFSPPDTDVPVVEFFDCPNLFATAVYRAFFNHCPLKISPSVVWLTILQGFATYVSTNAEALRHKFVVHEGKQVILIKRRDFSYGSEKNDWASVFPQFADEIEKRTNQGVRKLIECDFSNSTRADVGSSHITLMSICQYYFEHRLLGGCGIPWIELLGTTDDWKSVRRKAEELRQFEVAPPSGRGFPKSTSLDFFRTWLDTLLPVLDHFVQAAEGRPDIAFWGSVCNIDGGSGAVGDPITGWITAFFPYVGGDRRPFRQNDRISWNKSYEFSKKNGVDTARRYGEAKVEGKVILDGIRLSGIPSGIVSAPVHMEWLDVNLEQNLEFYGGIFALHQHPDGALEPRTGWAVVEQ
jgi:hypothetical protein